MSPSRFRRFLQGLKPGEIGFCIASIGAVSAGLLTYAAVGDRDRRREARAAARWRHELRHVERLVNEGAPLEGLSAIKWQLRAIRQEAEQEGVADATLPELADEWLRRRNRGEADALEIDIRRLRLKRFWHSIENAVQLHRSLDNLQGEQGDAGDNSGGDRLPSSAEPVLRELLSGGMEKRDANDRLCQKTLVFLERLDQACCRNHPACDWKRDRPSFYGFIRKEVGVAEDWPTDQTNEEDFSADAPAMNTAAFAREYLRTPDSRVSRAFEERDRALATRGRRPDR